MTDRDAEEQLLQEEQATATSLEESDWWLEGRPWFEQPMDKLREWHETNWRPLGGKNGRRS